MRRVAATIRHQGVARSSIWSRSTPSFVMLAGLPVRHFGWSSTILSCPSRLLRSCHRPRGWVLEKRELACWRKIPKASSAAIPRSSGAATRWPSSCSRLGLRYIALVPGSSYRGLHDSLVNYGGNRDPQMLVCLHEEHAVAIAHGYAKVTGRPMAVALHTNVGPDARDHGPLQRLLRPRADADRRATGPVDAARRRPWIDWIHTSADQGALIRPVLQVGRSARLRRGGA